MWPQGSPVSIRVARGSAALLSSHCRGIQPQDALKGEFRGLSRHSAGNPGFPQLVRVTSGSSHCAYWKSGIMWTWEGPLGLHCVWCNERAPLLKLRWEPQVSSPVLTWSRAVYAVSNKEVGLDMIEGMELCFPLELSKGFQASSRFEFGTWGSFWINKHGIRTPSCCELILG